MFARKRAFYPIIITCLLCLLFLKKNGVDFFDNGEVTASLRYAFHTKNILFSKNCHVAVFWSKVTNDPSKCSQERGLLTIIITCLLCLLFLKKMATLEKNGKNGFFQC